MKRRDFIKLIGIAGAVSLNSGCFGGTVEKSLLKTSNADKPNFLFILADDCTYRDIGCYGGQAHTPNIDQLAKQGMRFTHSFQAASMCSPTRHNIYTGLYPVKSGAYPNHTFARAGTQSIVHYLKPLGYRVAISGKRHINPKKVFPFEYLPGNKNPDMKAVDEFVAGAKAEDKPFCLFACSNEPHSPHDKGDASPYRDNTIVVLWSDHGYHMGEKNTFQKHTLWDRSAIAPLIIKLPNGMKDEIKKGRCDRVVGAIDLYPTLVDLCGLPANDKVMGRSLKPLLQEPTMEWDYPAFTFRKDNGKSLQYGHYRFIEYGDGSMELYDHRQDPHDWKNLAANSEHQWLISKLTAMFTEYKVFEDR